MPGASAVCLSLGKGAYAPVAGSELQRCKRTVLARGRRELHERDAGVHGQHRMAGEVRLVWSDGEYAGCDRGGICLAVRF